MGRAGNTGGQGELLRLDGLDAGRVSSGVAIRGDHVFWFWRPLALEGEWTTELRLSQLSTGKTQVLLSEQGLDALPDPTGKRVAATCRDNVSSGVFVISAATPARKTVVLPCNAEPERGRSISLLAWDKAGTRFWFGMTNSEAGPFEDVAVWDGKKVRTWQQPLEMDFALNPERGVVALSRLVSVTSDEVESVYADKPNTLVLHFLADNRQVVLVTGSGLFAPRWRGDVLEYDQNGVTTRVPYKKIEAARTAR